MPVSAAFSCQSAAMAVQRVQQQEQQSGAGAKPATQTSSDPGPQQDAVLSASIKTVRRFTNTPAPTTMPALLRQQPSEHQQEEQEEHHHHHHRRGSLIARKRLSLPFRRTSQVFASAITDVDIYYGSMTGTAARFAALLAKDVADRGVNTTLQSLEHFDERAFDGFANTHASVFVVSTHFAGSASPSAELFYEWLRAASSSTGGASVAQTQAQGYAPAVMSETLASLDLSAAESHSKDAASTVPAAANSIAPSAGSSPLRFLLNWGRDFSRKRSRAHQNRLEALQYAVFGVGSSEYLTFNAMAKFVDARLHILGGTRLTALGLGDVIEDIDAAFLKWRSGFLQQLPLTSHNIRLIAFENDLLLMEPPQQPKGQQQQCQQRMRTRSGSLNRMQQYQHQQDDHRSSHHSSKVPSAASRNPTTVKSKVVDRYNKHVRLRFRCHAIATPAAPSRRSSLSTKQTAVVEISPASTKHNLHTRRPSASLQSISLLHPDTGSSKKGEPAAASNQSEPRAQVALVRIALLNPDLKFEAADTFAYLPQNCPELVERIAAGLDFDLDTWIELYVDRQQQDQQQHQLPFSTPCTVRTALTEFLELNTVTREFLRVASGFVEDDSERDLLEQLASTDGSTAFTNQFAKQHKGILQLLDLAPSLKIPFEVFVNITPLIKPRLYSIACSHLKNPREIELAVDIGRQEEPHGVSVSYFRKLMSALQIKKSSGVMLRACIAQSPFKVPSDTASPMIMIANGIGIAPVRALLQHRKLEHDRLGGGARVPTPSLLLYGCKDLSSIPFESDLRALEREGYLMLKLAFPTRDDDENPCEDIQIVVARHLQDIVELTSSCSEARIFVSGTAAMARSVRQVLQSYTSSEAQEGGENWFDEMVRSGRFVQDSF